MTRNRKTPKDNAKSNGEGDKYGMPKESRQKMKLQSKCIFSQFQFSFRAKLNRHQGKLLIGLLSVALYLYLSQDLLGFIRKYSITVNVPFHGPSAVQKRGLDVADRFWGSYRPGLYFGMKARTKKSPLFGLMWFEQPTNSPNIEMRHWCEQGDHLQKYTWLAHDGATFGVQQILDGPFNITTSFVKTDSSKQYGGDWTARIFVNPNQNYVPTPQPGARLKRQVAPPAPLIALFFYVALDDGGTLEPDFVKIDDEYKYLAGIHGEAPDLGRFKLTFNTALPNIKLVNYLLTEPVSPNDIKGRVMQSFELRMLEEQNRPIATLRGASLVHPNQKPGMIVHQVTASLPYQLEVVYRAKTNANEVATGGGKEYSLALKEHQMAFEERFEKVFKLRAKGYKDAEIEFARAVFSNLVGGIGYFYGVSLVQDKSHSGPYLYFPTELYSAVPSRSFFPRGFLWDEGFHNLLIAKWDPEISKDIIAHWLDFMNIEGWIPRELILGPEAIARVPPEFIVQRNTNANPPTLFLTLQTLLQDSQSTVADTDFLQRIYPRLVKWYDWFNTTQIGQIDATYRWRGRNSTANELNPKTLTSGLDDYPRASHPSDLERHVDLRCWMAVSSQIMHNINKILGKTQAESDPYLKTYELLSDNKVLNNLHWSPTEGRYSDYGLHTDKVRLEWRKLPYDPRKNPDQTSREKVRVVKEEPVVRFVDTTFGYVSLFPFLLELVDADSPQLGKILKDLRNPNLLWTEFGLRSLAKSSPFYNKFNTEHDPPYWRGSIWVNMNFLALRALFNYGLKPGPYKEDASALYKDLKSRVVGNMFKIYSDTGYVWENFDDKEGKGKGSHPFTGWSSLVVLIMADLY